MRSICISRLLPALGTMCLAANALAQTAVTTPNPCPSSTAPVLASFAVERVLDLTQVLSTGTPTLPASVATAVQNKVAEIHESLTFNSQNQVLTLNLFPMQAGSPIPTPPNGVAPGTVFSTLAVSIDKIYTTCTPSTLVMFLGTVTGNSSAIYGNVSGAEAAVSVGLTNDNPPKIINVIVVYEGTSVAYSAAGAGTVTFNAPSVTPPAQGGGPSIIVKVQALTTLPFVDLDASASTSQNLPLTFQWSVIAGAADIANRTAAKATGYILGGVGTYTFRVTVTDSKGNVATKDVMVQYV